MIYFHLSNGRRLYQIKQSPDLNPVHYRAFERIIPVVTSQGFSHGNRKLRAAVWGNNQHLAVPCSGTLLAVTSRRHLQHAVTCASAALHHDSCPDLPYASIW